MERTGNTPKLTPDGKPNAPRKTGDEAAQDSVVDGVEDPEIAGDAGNPGYGNTDESSPTSDGFVRHGDDEDRPLV